MLVAVPALRALRAAFPDARVALVGLPWASWLVDRFPAYVDEHIEFPGYPGLNERAPRIRAIPPFLTAVQRRRFDLAIQLQGAGPLLNGLAALLGASETAGFHAPDEPCPDPARYVPHDPREAEVARHLRLLSTLGIPPRGTHLELPLREHELRRARYVLGDAGTAAGRFAIVHPGLPAPSRPWEAERFAAVARTLAMAGLGVLLTGSAEERPFTDHVRQLSGVPVQDLAGETDLGTLGALVSQARLVVSDDPSLEAMAAVHSVPLVAVSRARRTRAGISPPPPCRACERDGSAAACPHALEADAVAMRCLDLLGDPLPAARAS